MKGFMISQVVNRAQMELHIEIYSRKAYSEVQIRVQHTLTQKSKS